VEGLWVSAAKANENHPQIKEIGLTSAPLLALAFHLGAFCKEYNDDFVKCKAENGDPEACLLEGRKITRCTQDLINKVKTNCFDSFTKHYKCLDDNNQQLEKCRVLEKVHNECVSRKLKIEKVVKGAPDGVTPIHLKPNPIYK
jgi:NADH dehydrogenase (ubiquinone) 1 alpha subcomplex subunit 8